VSGVATLAFEDRQRESVRRVRRIEASPALGRWSTTSAGQILEKWPDQLMWSWTAICFQDLRLRW